MYRGVFILAPSLDTAIKQEPAAFPSVGNNSCCLRCLLYGKIKGNFYVGFPSKKTHSNKPRNIQDSFCFSWPKLISSTAHMAFLMWVSGWAYFKETNQNLTAVSVINDTIHKADYWPKTIIIHKAAKHSKNKNCRQTGNQITMIIWLSVHHSLQSFWSA